MPFCPSCGNETDPGQKFCGNCGSPLDLITPHLNHCSTHLRPQLRCRYPDLHLCHLLHLLPNNHRQGQKRWFRKRFRRIPNS
jgi:predicted amidophosphoribosyltransferase